MLVRWHDNSCVKVASTADRVQPITKARHWSSKEKKEVQILMPDAIHEYNRYMGGVDRLDQNIQNVWQLYRVSSSYIARPMD